ncbi:Uu.00g093190.m01.CDS01 [Anthostomella pinea]|uniref:Uu.00g093190.m01.CDS01 n=1 Tax=Anthostomella pinea TaxID=933095 RepID=A0AAI8YKN7_9PEZI|nr:Uu.00g093190.m01.CDS01 [Anthostomella pinea]
MGEATPLSDLISDLRLSPRSQTFFEQKDQVTRLPPDVWYKIASEYLHDPKDVYNLGRTCYMLWAMLETQLYITDALHYKAQLEGGQLRHKWFHDKNEEIAEYWEGPFTTPSCGCFPDEVNWQFGEELEKRRKSTLEYLEGLRDMYGDSVDYERYERELAGYPDPLPTRIPAASVLQWAAAAGVVSTARKAIDAARIVWPRYLSLQHPQNLHQSIHLAAISGSLEIVQLLVEYAGTSSTVASGYLCLPTKPLYKVISHVSPTIKLEVLEFYHFGNMEAPFVLDALGLAILNGHEGVASWLLERCDCSRYIKPPIDIHDPENWESDEAISDEYPVVCPLHLAALTGMNSIVQGLLAKGAHVDTLCEQLQHSTPLMWACTRRENQAVIDTLLSHGPNLQIRDTQRRSVLIWALEHKLPEVAYRIIEAGVPVDNWVFSHTDSCGLSLSLILRMHPELPAAFLTRCFHEALGGVKDSYRRGVPLDNEETVRMFIDQNIGQGVLQESDYNEIMPVLIRDNMQNLGATPLHVAAYHASPKILRLLLDKQPENVNARDADGNTPLVLAARTRKASFKKMAVLLEYGADPESALGNLEESAYGSDEERDAIAFAGDANTPDGHTARINRTWDRRARMERGISTKEALRRRIPKAVSGDIEGEQTDGELDRRMNGRGVRQGL